MFKAIQSYYKDTVACVKLNNKMSDWFEMKNGVRQGDPMLPTLFSLFINDLAKEIRKMRLGIKVGNELLNILLYADDMVFTASDEKDLKLMLNKMFEWSNKWRLKVNVSKTKIVHFRNT